MTPEDEAQFMAQHPKVPKHLVRPFLDQLSRWQAVQESVHGMRPTPRSGAVVLLRDEPPPCPQCGGRRTFKSRWRPGATGGLLGGHMIVLCERGCTADGGKIGRP